MKWLEMFFSGTSKPIIVDVRKGNDHSRSIQFDASIGLTQFGTFYVLNVIEKRTLIIVTIEDTIMIILVYFSV